MGQDTLDRLNFELFGKQRYESFGNFKARKIRVGPWDLLHQEVQDLYSLPWLLLELHPEVVAHQAHEGSVLSVPEHGQELFYFRFAIHRLCG